MIDKSKQLDDHHWKVESIFNQVVDHSDQETKRMLDQLCGSDTAIRSDVQRLLSVSDESLGGFMQTPKSSLSDSSGIAGYKIIKQIGEGGMGSVFLAEQENPNRQVALKSLKSVFASDEIRKRFEYEGQVLGRLQHPGIAQIYEAGSVTVRNPAGLEVAQPYFAMEFVDGCSLTQYASEQSLSIVEKLRLVIDVCAAVNSAHQQGVIHRDLKPANILVAASGRVKILDFGVARLIDDDAIGNVFSTQTGQLIGTLAYMSPEQMTGESSNVDTRSDVYSIGVLLYELLSQHKPYEIGKLSIPDAVQKIRNEIPKRVSVYDSKLRGDIETIVEKAIEKDKDRRYQSIDQLAADIDRYLNQHPIQSRPVSQAEKTWLWCRRRPLVAGLCAALAMSIVAGITGIVWQWQAAKTQAVLADSKRKQAQENYLQAKQAIDNLTELSLKLSDVPGAHEIRTAALREVLAFYANKANDMNRDESSRFELANTLYRMAQIRYGMLDIEAAISEGLAALNVYKKLVDDFPDEIKYQNCLAISHSSLAKAYLEGRQFSKAMENRRESSRIYQRLWTVGRDCDWSIEYANSLTNLARSWSDLGKPVRAATVNQTAIEILQSYNDKSSELYLSSYRWALECQFDILLAEDRIEDAISSISKAVKLHRMAWPDVPANDDGDHELHAMRLRTKLANALFQQDRDSDRWQVEFEAARQSIDSMWDARRDRPPLGTSYVWLLEQTAYCHWQAGNRQRSGNDYSKAIEILDDILDRFTKQDVAVSQICRILATCPVTELRNVERAFEICNAAAGTMPHSRNISNTLTLLNSIEQEPAADRPPSAELPDTGNSK